MKKIWKVLLVLAAIIAAGVYYYVTIPAINIHASGFWFFLIGALAGVTAIIALYKIVKTKTEIVELGQSKLIKVMLGVIIGSVAIYLAGTLLSSEIINARKYQQLMTVQDGDFKTEIAPADFSNVPLLDKDSARLLGNRKMGTMVDMVSQFEVSPLYTQINYQGTPVRVSPLIYASPIKWIANQADGIPAYIMIDMATQETECVRLPEGQYIKYSPAEYFNRNIYRHLRFN